MIRMLVKKKEKNLLLLHQLLGRHYGSSNWGRKAKEATVSGMLDGYDSVSDIDLEDSLAFIDKFRSLLKKRKTPTGEEYCLDCGAGIGRVTKGCLLKKFQNVL
eukprot:Platyproteum_vivax@DN12737_c0_g1_i1.p1